MTNRPFWQTWTHHDGAWWCCQVPFKRDGWEQHIRELHPGRLRKIKKWLRHREAGNPRYV